MRRGYHRAVFARRRARAQQRQQERTKITALLDTLYERLQTLHVEEQEDIVLAGLRQ